MRAFFRFTAIVFMVLLSFHATAESKSLEYRVQQILKQFEASGWTVIVEDVHSEGETLQIGTLALYSSNFLISISVYDLVMEGFHHHVQSRGGGYYGSW